MKITTQSTTTSVKPQFRHPGSKLFLRLARITLWLLTGIVTVTAIGAVYQVIATEMDKRAYPPPGQLVDVDGYQIHLFCMGTSVDGSPTVILETGLGATSSTWALVQPEVAKMTRVCSYDRAGMGWSDPGQGPRDAQHIASELHALLQAAGISDPYVLVGWSYGGLYAREYAGLWGDEVAGLVLLDSSHPDQWTSTPQGKAQYERNAKMYSVAPAMAYLGITRFMGLFQPDSGLPAPHGDMLKASFAATKDWDAQSAEFLASLASAAEIRGQTSVGDIPLIVLSATEHGTPPEEEQLWQNWQMELAALSSNSSHQIVPGADHASFWRDPIKAKLSIAAILEVVEAARTGVALK